MTDQTSRRGRYQRYGARAAGALLSAGIVAWLLFVVLPDVGDVEGAGALLAESVGLVDVAWLSLLAAAHVLTFAAILTAALPAVRFWPALGIRLLSGAIGKLLPAGPALGAGALAAVLHRRGFGPEVASRTVVVTGVWSQLTKMALPVVGVIAVLVSGTEEGAGRPLLVVAGAGAGLLGTLLLVRVLLLDEVAHVIARVTERPIALLGRLLNRTPPADLAGWLLAFQDATAAALRYRWVQVAGWNLAHHATHVGLLWVGLAAVSGPGGPVATWPEVLTVMAVGYLLTGLPVAPGGLGALDVVVVAGLGLVGEDPGVATAAVALYRIATYAIHIPVAILAWPFWRRLTRETT